MLRGTTAAALFSLALLACADNAIDLFPTGGSSAADAATASASALHDGASPLQSDSQNQSDEGVGFECSSDNDCTSGSAPRCEPALHTCVQCIGNDDCSGRSKSTCNRVTNRCAFSCADDGDCPSGDVCDTTQGVCVECQSDSQCFDPSEPICVQERCVQCESAQDCPTGTQCWQAACVECVTTANCPHGETCTPDNECR